MQCGPSSRPVNLSLGQVRPRGSYRSLQGAEVNTVGGFIGVVTGFPTAVFTFALVVVVGYWGLVMVGGSAFHRGGHTGHVGHTGHGGAGGHGGHGGSGGRGGPAGHGGHQGADGGHLGIHGGHQGAQGGHAQGGHHGHGGLRRVLGLGGVPITVSLSLLIALSWFSSLVGTVLLHGRFGGALLPAALVGGWLGTRVLVWPLRRVIPTPGPPPSRLDFVGRGCVIRTGRVGPDFGQAEVRSDDGSAALVQVRQTLDEAAGPGSVLTKGAYALIYDYDDEGEFFRVIPDLPARL
jgi:hypothetical protein